jgi:hypothetical protein
MSRFEVRVYGLDEHAQRLLGRDVWDGSVITVDEAKILLEDDMFSLQPNSPAHMVIRRQRDLKRERDCD